jgi:hypothetical protein
MSDNQTPKASYHQPTFSIYGNLSDLTKAGGALTQTDGATQGNNMSKAPK